MPSARIYPQHNIFSNLVGIKTPHLVSKLEKNHDEVLNKGNDLRLTLDLRIQNRVIINKNFKIFVIIPPKLYAHLQK